MYETPPPAPSAHSSSFEASVRAERRFKKGKTRMPKRLVRQEAIMDLGYPFDEEEDFYVLRIALEKEQIDEVIKISESYKDGGMYILITIVVTHRLISQQKRRKSTGSKRPSKKKPSLHRPSATAM
jgi:chlorite dismutase